MQYRLRTIFYVMTLVAACLSLFGGWGVLVAAWVLAVWGITFWSINTEDKKKVAAVVAGSIVILLAILLTWMLLLPGHSKAREPAHRNSCRNRLKQISLALHNYQDTYGSFPPAYIADKNGKPIHSWRVLILPFLEDQALYNAYDFDEPWNGPNNSKLAKEFDIYQCPSVRWNTDSGIPITDTQYFAILGDTTAWPGAQAVKASDVTDGVDNTIFVIEVAGKGINWMEPRDVTLAEAVKLLGPEAKATSTAHVGVREMAYGDGHVKEAGVWDDPKGIEALFTIAANDKAVNISRFNKLPKSEKVRNTQRDLAISFALFILIVLLPIPWAIKKYREEKRAAFTRSQNPPQ